MELVPIKSTIPKPLLSDGEGWEDYADALTDFTEQLAEDALDLRNLLVPEETPYPGVLAGSLGAYTSVYDDPEELRRKAAGAARFAKNRRLFQDAWKPVLDRITGEDTSIWRGKWSQGGFRIGIDYIGLKPIGNGGPPYLDWSPGDVLIDLVHVPTADETQRIRAQFSQVCPTYFRVWTGNVQTLDADYLGTDYTSGDYLTSEDVFVVADFLNRYQYVDWQA